MQPIGYDDRKTFLRNPTQSNHTAEVDYYTFLTIDRNWDAFTQIAEAKELHDAKAKNMWSLAVHKGQETSNKILCHHAMAEDG